MTKAEQLESGMCTVIQWLLRPFGVKPITVPEPNVSELRIDQVSTKDGGQISMRKYEAKKPEIQRKEERQTAKRHKVTNE